MPAQYMILREARQVIDAADAEAICEAVTRPTMRFVGVKTAEQQSIMMLRGSDATAPSRARARSRAPLRAFGLATRPSTRSPDEPNASPGRFK